jgi:hypothetical protein
MVGVYGGAKIAYSIAGKQKKKKRKDLWNHKSL